MAEMFDKTKIDLDAAERGLLEVLTRDDLFRLGLICSTDVSSEDEPEREANFVAAHKWFNLAASKGHEEAGWCRADISDEMTAVEISEAQRRAREWLRAGSVRAA